MVLFRLKEIALSNNVNLVGRNKDFEKMIDVWDLGRVRQEDYRLKASWAT